MSLNTALATQSAAPAVLASKEERDVVYKAFGSEDNVKLNLSIVKNYVAVPYITMQGNQQVTLLPDDRECLRFMMLCRGQRADPFQGDAYMVPFWDKKLNKPVWSLITGIVCFRKRAETNPDFDGMESGVIVMNTDTEEVKELEGDFLPPSTQLLGGWANVHFKNKKIPTRRKVNLSTYKKGFGVWMSDEAGMIVKVAEAQALRDSFPTLLGGFQLKEEVIDLEPARVEVSAPQSERRPDFAKGLPPINVEVAGARPQRPTSAPRNVTPAQTSPQAQTPAPRAAQVTPQPTAAAVQQAEAALATPDPAPQTDEQAEAEAGLAPVAQPEAAQAETATAPEPEPAAEQQAEDPALAESPTDSAEVKQLKALARRDGVTMAQMLAWMVSKKLCTSGQTLGDVAPKNRAAIITLWAKKVAEMQAL